MRLCVCLSLSLCGLIRSDQTSVLNWKTKRPTLWPGLMSRRPKHRARWRRINSKSCIGWKYGKGRRILCDLALVDDCVWLGDKRKNRRPLLMNFLWLKIPPSSLRSQENPPNGNNIPPSYVWDYMVCLRACVRYRLSSLILFERTGGDIRVDDSIKHSPNGPQMDHQLMKTGFSSYTYLHILVFDLCWCAWQLIVDLFLFYFGKVLFVLELVEKGNLANSGDIFFFLYFQLVYS